MSTTQRPIWAQARPSSVKVGPLAAKVCLYSTSIGQFAPISGPMTARPTLCRQRRRSGRRSDSFCGSPRGNRAPCTCRACVACEAVRVIQGLRRMRVLLLLRPLVRPRRRQMSQPDHLGCPGRGLAGVRADVSTVPRPVSRPWPRWCLGLWPGSVPAVSRTWPRCPGRGPARVPDCALGPKPRWRPCTRVCASRRGALLCKDQPGISCHHHFMSLGISCHHHFAPPPPPHPSAPKASARTSEGASSPQATTTRTSSRAYWVAECSPRPSPTHPRRMPCNGVGGWDGLASVGKVVLRNAAAVACNQEAAIFGGGACRNLIGSFEVHIDKAHMSQRCSLAIFLVEDPQGPPRS